MSISSLRKAVSQIDRVNTEILTLASETNENVWNVYTTKQTEAGSLILPSYQLKENIRNIKFLGRFKRFKHEKFGYFYIAFRSKVVAWLGKIKCKFQSAVKS
jgi:hypothetical protein